MTVYGGYSPTTYNAWALNLFNTVFVSAGIARGLQVSATSPASMLVTLSTDPTWNDGVCFLPNGCFLRIDAGLSLTVSPNTSGATRTDAVVATVDPTNAAALSLSIQANWPSGFSGTSAQLVLALISVANNATSIINSNITQTSAVAKVTGTGGGGGSMTASDGVGLTVQDNSATSTLSLVLTGLTTGVGRNITIQTTDTSAIGHAYTFDTTGKLLFPTGTGAILRSAGGGAAGVTVWVGTTDPGSLAVEGDIWFKGRWSNRFSKSAHEQCSTRFSCLLHTGRRDVPGSIYRDGIGLVEVW